MSIFEILEKRDVKPSEEFRRLVTLFRYQWRTLYGYTSVKQIINGIFHKVPVQIRQTFLSVDELLKELRVSEDSYYGNCWKELFLYSEMLLNLIDTTKAYLDEDETARETAQQIVANIKVILEKTNHEWRQIKDGYIIVDKNPATTEAIECLEEKNADLALNMIEYNRVLLKGNLQRKREILSNMAGYVEPMKILFKGTDYLKLYDDSRNMVNKLNVRHNNSGKDDVPEYAKNWGDKEYEEWYDNAYHTLLMVILAKKQLEITRAFNKLKHCES
ncbi:hypothetical protein [Fibrobacter succinogenes]|uniref:hypothetical protein n=1 Tax=Fibrobacter succinogenes TaxID=833 RepID=UPI001567F735|nr:hypothetical protein [Fibrobacter succinogenes]